MILFPTRTRDSIRIRTGKEDSVDPHFDGPNSHSYRNLLYNENANFSAIEMVTSTIYRPIRVNRSARKIMSSDMNLQNWSPLFFGMDL
uniref:Cytochrome c oxidase subunit 1 n=1 Tax=Steinernema glaseri TaxID=37863 RepID=A0A1I7YU01_9BILA